MLITAKTAFILLIIGSVLVFGSVVNSGYMKSDKLANAFLAGVGAAFVLVAIVVELVSAGVL